MKAIRILVFIVLVMAVLGAAWYFYPEEGFKVGKLNLHFPSYAEAQTQNQEENTVDVDKVLNDVSNSYINYSEDLMDSLYFFREYLMENPNRIYLPDNDYRYFDSLFTLFEQAKEEGKTYRVMHYGDSQIEMDRISSVLRQKLQEFFGGSGPNMIPAIQAVPTISVQQSCDNLKRYTLYGDSSTHRAPHNRYGVMTQFAQVAGEGSISFNQSSHSKAFENSKMISSVSILLGRNSQGFKATLKCDTVKVEPKVLDANDSVSLITWNLPVNVKRGVIHMKGKAEIYAILLDGEPGVAIDNVVRERFSPASTSPR